VTSSFICENCGIKVAGAEGSDCPGCGQNSAGAASDALRISETDTTLPNNGNLFTRRGVNEEWVARHVMDCESIFDKEKSYTDQPDLVRQVIAKVNELIPTAPDLESSRRLHAYLSEMYRVSESYLESIKAATVGVESTEQFFKFQSHNSMLDSLFNLERLEDFTSWIQKSFDDDFPDANYFKIRYLTKLGEFDEALKLCDSHYDSDAMYLNANRADILVKAKRFDEAELILRKLTSNNVRGEHAANWANTLAFSILIPQGRTIEAEKLLVSVLCTSNYRERINAYSNLALLSLSINEVAAAKRYASIATVHPENAIASESRLTLCKIELKRLQENESSTVKEWADFFNQVKAGLEITDFDDAPAFLDLLITSAPKAEMGSHIVGIIEKEFTRLRGLFKWNGNPSARANLQGIRVNELAKFYLEEKNYLKLDELFTSALTDSPDQGFDSLLDYLRTPFAAIDLRRSALKVSDKHFLAQWAAFEKHEEIIFSLAKHTEEPILVALAENPATPEPVCELIYNRNDIDLDFALCNRENLTAKMTEMLAKSTFEAVRKLIAMRTDLNQEIYTLLATDSAMLVRDAIRENQACTPEIRALAALGSL
jgi:tetratricopeptide (TPR) repeat protein